MFSEDDLLPISALQHLVFCPRQWALIHLEQIWTENALTAQGQVLHDRVHDDTAESRAGIRLVRSLAIRSLSLGLTGKADLVEFHRLPDTDTDGATLPNISGLYRPFPVEFKHGRPKSDRCDEIQLCAQALCLEEMLSTHIPAGALFYGQPKRRTDVLFDNALRSETLTLISRLHELTRLAQTPPPHFSSKCKNCSLISHCLPEKLSQTPRVDEYITHSLASLQQNTDPRNP